MFQADNTFIRVEYDAEFSGGDYSGSGNFILLSRFLVEKSGSVESAFTKKTGLPADCMIHFSMDESLDERGQRLEDEVLPSARPPGL